MSETFGILLSVAAAVIFGISTIIQKYAMKKMKRFSLSNLLHNRSWLSSFIVGSIGVLCYLAAIMFYKVSYVQSIITLSAIIPVLSGALIFKEKLGVEKWVSILLILIGVAIVIS